MKKFFSLLCLVFVIGISNCSKIPENNDPILGIWARTTTETIEGKQTSQREEWIFNDAFLGRYHRFNGDNLEFYTDFKWAIEDDIYTIGYRGVDMPEAKVKMVEAQESETLQYENGSLFASRE